MFGELSGNEVQTVASQINWNLSNCMNFEVNRNNAHKNLQHELLVNMI